jgi:hypothetical protein
MGICVSEFRCQQIEATCAEAKRDFSDGVVSRHQSKLILGTDCSCVDGRLAKERIRSKSLTGPCVAREPDPFQSNSLHLSFSRVSWENGSGCSTFRDDA